MNSSLIAIRKATPEDARGIAYVQVEGWRSSYSNIIDADYLESLNVDHRTKIWEKNLFHLGAITWVAIDQDQIVGFCGVGALRSTNATAELDYHKTGEIYAIYILPSHQRQGLGLRFFNFSREYFSSNGMTQFVVWALEDNEPARLFYKNQGGIPFAEERRPVSGQDYLEICYVFKGLENHTKSDKAQPP